MNRKRRCDQSTLQGHRAWSLRRRGQAIVETGFVIVALIMLSIGLIQYGLIYNATLTLTNLTRDGARYAGIEGTEVNVQALTRTYLRDKARSSSIPPQDLPDANIRVIQSSRASGTPITVEVTYNMRNKFFVPVPEWGGLQDNNSRWSQFKTTATASIE